MKTSIALRGHGRFVTEGDLQTEWDEGSAAKKKEVEARDKKELNKKKQGMGKPQTSMRIAKQPWTNAMLLLLVRRSCRSCGGSTLSGRFRSM